MELIKKCEQLKEGLEMCLEMAVAIQAETKTANLDVSNTRAALHAVNLRIGYLKKLQATAAELKKQADADKKAADEKAAADKKAADEKSASEKSAVDALKNPTA